MSRYIKVTGYAEIEDSEYDDGPSGPLAQDAWEEFQNRFVGLEDLDFSEDDR